MNYENGSLFRFLGSLLLSILGLWLIYAILTGAGYGTMGTFGYMGGGHENMSFYVGTGPNIMGTISFILLFLIKLLFILFIIGLVVGIAIAIKNYIFTNDDVEKIKGTFTDRKAESCGICGKELNAQWKVCPYCGKGK